MDIVPRAFGLDFSPGAQVLPLGQGGPSGGQSVLNNPWPYMVGSVQLLAPPYGAPQAPTNKPAPNQIPTDVNGVNPSVIFGLMKMPTNQVVF